MKYDDMLQKHVLTEAPLSDIIVASNVFLYDANLFSLLFWKWGIRVVL